MTSGKGNQGMSNRIGGSQDRGSGAFRQPVSATTGRGRGSAMTTTGGRKTTSALFREIDDLVSMEGKGRKTEMK
jgi:hypothetical protein